MKVKLLISIALSICITQTAFAQDTKVTLAKKLNNPVAALISVPLQLNYDSDIGSNDTGDRYLINIQPVIPFSLNEEWNIISRTIVPVITQHDILPASGRQTGLGDIVQSLFFSPAQPTESGWIWGVGPVFLLPTATDNLLGTKKWGVGPTAVALKQQNGFTYGALLNHIWSVAGDSSRADISATFMQPFFLYTTKDALTVGINTESTYDWKTERWTVPLNFVASKVIPIGGQMISVGGGLRYWAKTADTGPEGWGARFSVTFLLPK